MKVLLNRLLALILLLMVPLLAWLGVAEPVHTDYVRERRSIAADQDNLARFKAIAGRLEEYQSGLRRQRQDPGLSQAVLRADSETLAAADLQQRVKSVVEKQGGALVSTQVMETLPQAPFTQIRINVRMLLNVPVLQRVLHEIEGQIPYLTVRRLLVTNRYQRGRNKRRQAQQTESLDVRMTIIGYWYPSGQALRAG